MNVHLIAAAIGAALISSPALADTINFGQWGGDTTAVASGTTGTTANGVSFTITSPLGVTGGPVGFTVYQQSVDWGTGYNPGTLILFDNFTPGAVTITFATPISSITDIALQTDLFGSFTGTMTAYDGLVPLGSDVISSVSGGGVIQGFSFSAPDITSLVFTATNDGQGFALGASAPEPATWALMLAGFTGLGAMLRTRRRTVPA